MPIQLTIVGFNRVGVSIGLALAEHSAQIYRCGCDPTPSKNKKVDPEGAFDKNFHRLSEATKGADVVILCLPVDQIEETLKEIAQDLKENAVVINTSPVCVAFSNWAKKLLPDGRHFLTLFPVLSGFYLNDNAFDALTPHDDLFKNADILISADFETKQYALSIASELTTLLRAYPCFIDPVEADGILAKVELLPKLTASILLLATLDTPGWKDTRRIASSTYAKATNAVDQLSENAHPGAEVLNNRDNVLLALDGLAAALIKIRGLVASEDAKSLDSLLTDLRDNHVEWVDLRIEGDWDKKNLTITEKPASQLTRWFGSPPKFSKK